MLIETADEINPQDLRGVRRAGVSAGASTPDWMIRRVVIRLREIDRLVNAPEAV
jgi:4-hydroxy-3-methylbut-2-enyl diphosphate reductase